MCVSIYTMPLFVIEHFRYGWWTCSKRRLLHLPASCRLGHASPLLPLPCTQQLPRLCVQDWEARGATHQHLQCHLGRSQRALVYDLSHRNLPFVIRDTLIVWWRLVSSDLHQHFLGFWSSMAVLAFVELMIDWGIGWMLDGLSGRLNDSVIDRVNECWLTDWPISWMTDGFSY